MNRIERQIIIGAILCMALPAVGAADVAAIQNGDHGQCYDIEAEPTIYSDLQVIRNLRLLGLEPVTAHGATPSAAGDDTGPIQDAIFLAMEDCVNAQGLDSFGNRNGSAQGVPTGAARDIYIDSCRAVFFPPGEYRVSDTIRVMQPLKPKSGTLNLFLNSNDRITFNGDATPEVDEELAKSGAGTALALRRKSNVLIGSTCPWGGLPAIIDAP